MKRSPMELAAIATAAVPGLTPVGVGALADDADDFDSALVRDAQQNEWRVRAPRHDEASMRLESELAALRSFTPAVRASLPFRIPSVAGTVRQGSLRTFVYNHLDGRNMPLDDLVAAGGNAAASVGRTIAVVHGLPKEVVDRADLPMYSAEEFRQRRLNALDQAATTGKIPSRLLRRWEHALEDVSLWRFNPTVVHGDLHEENLLLDGADVTAVTGWTDLHIGDPSDDLAWLAAAHEQSFSDAVFEAYVGERGDKADPHLMRRAALSAEFALAQWLVKAVSVEDPERIAEAEQMLADLDEDIAEYGGQPISVIDQPRFGAGDTDEDANGGPDAEDADRREADEPKPSAEGSSDEDEEPAVTVEKPAHPAVVVLDDVPDDDETPASRGREPLTSASFAAVAESAAPEPATSDAPASTLADEAPASSPADAAEPSSPEKPADSTGSAPVDEESEQDELDGEDSISSEEDRTPDEVPTSAIPFIQLPAKDDKD
ncbi:phosphotransferase [Zhihengliuella halotolerans]